MALFLAVFMDVLKASEYSILHLADADRSQLIINVFLKSLPFAKPCVRAKDEKYFPSSRSKCPSSEEGKVKYCKENSINKGREVGNLVPLLDNGKYFI